MLIFRPTYDMTQIAQDVKAQLSEKYIDYLTRIAVEELEYEKTSQSTENTESSN